MPWMLPNSERVPSPNHYRKRRGRVTSILVLHYAVDGDQTRDDPEISPEESLNFAPRDADDDCMDVARLFARKKRRASSHLVIGRDGSKAEMVDSDDGAWHAGGGKLPEAGVGKLSEGKTDINRRSYGIEVCNAGWAVEKLKIPAKRRIRLAHPATPRRTQTWEKYTDAAIATLEYCVALVKQVVPSIRIVCGHEDVVNRHTLNVKYGGKVDPGPAFPWEAIDWASLGILAVRYDYQRRGWVPRFGAQS